MNRNLLLLTLCQGLFLTNNVVFIAINGLVGLQLAPTAWMATLPLTAYVAGGALSTALVARHQRKVGRKRAFQVGLLWAIGATALCAYAAWQRSFWLLVLGTVLAGYYQANGSLYRFAAAELVPPAAREKAHLLGAGRRHHRRRVRARTWPRPRATCCRSPSPVPTCRWWRWRWWRWCWSA